MKTPEIVHSIADLRARVGAWRKGGARVGLVPTMGALHEGHLSLVRETQSRAAKLAGVRLDLIFAPSVAEMYPAGFATKVEVGGPSAGLETDFRPHFFGGVATVVTNLLTAALPDVAIFGEKDYQQLMVI